MRLCAEEVKGIVFALIHYNRISTLKQALKSILGEIRKGDCIILIDNGSPLSEQRAALDYFNNKTRHLRDQIQTLTAPIETNQGGIKAYAALLSCLISDRFPSGKHLVLLGDDDMLAKGWRSEVEPYLDPNDWVAWGYHYFNWNNRMIDKIKEHSSRIEMVEGPVAHRQWLSGITGHSEHHGRQEHPSCVAISLQTLRQAAAKIPSLLPMPYGDVGLALMINYAANLIYIDKALGLIGRGTNYGMGDAERMAKNHPTRNPILGRPSHKYSAATYAKAYLLSTEKTYLKTQQKIYCGII